MVEPNSTFYSSIEVNRSAQLFKCAAGSKNGDEIVFHGTLDGEYSYVENEFVGLGVKRAPMFDSKVPMVSLNSILCQASAPLKIDFLSIDVEGYEIEVLDGIDFSKWKFQVICIEHNYNQAKRLRIHTILKEQGYINVLECASQFDSFYVVPEIEKSLLL